IPELEHVGGINTELRHFRSIRRHSNKMFGDRLFVASETCKQPIAGGARVRHCFQGRESFRGNDEKRFCWFEVPNGLSKVGTVYVGNEPTRHGSIAVIL